MQNVKQCIHAEQAHWRVWFWAACELFVLFSMLRSLRMGPLSDALVCLLVGIGVLVPYVLETWGYRVSNALLVFSMLYLLGGMSGRIYKLYYLIAHWDKLLHFSGGVVFAVLGSYIPVLLNKDYQDDRRLRILFAVLFSISVSALWEFYEYGMDRWFGTDMQRDTLVTALHSYDLGDAVGVIGSIDQIDSVIVNGIELEGYIDIGLIDTMGDMMIETAGTVVYAASGVLFPLPVAIAVNLAGTAVMVSLPYWLGRKLGSQAVQYILRRWPKSAMLRELRDGSDFFFVLIVRLLGILSADVVSAYMGAVGVRYRDYLPACLLGFLTTCVLFPIMGMSLSDIRSPQFLTAAGIQLAEMLVSCIAFHFYRKKHIKQPMDCIKERTADQ